MQTKWLAIGMVGISFLLIGCDEPAIENQEATATVSSGEKASESPSLSEDEQSFNDSGSAKAIESETDLWPFFEDKTLGMQMNYPLNYALVDNESFELETEKNQLKIVIKDIGEQVNPWDYGPEESQKNIEALAAGAFGSTGENAVEKSKKAIMVANIFAQDMMVLSRIDMCNVTLERKAQFYFNNKQIEITAYGSVAKLKETMPEYFKYDEPNCGDMKVWDLTKLDQFYDSLTQGKASSEIQQWYDDFDRMMGTVVFLHK